MILHLEEGSVMIAAFEEKLEVIGQRSRVVVHLYGPVG